MAAFATASVGVATGSLALALLAAVAVGVALSMLHGYACVTHRGDQVVLGMAITMTAAGLTVVLGIAWFHTGGQTPPLPDTVRYSPWFGGAADALAAVPLVGKVLALALLGHNLQGTLTYAYTPLSRTSLMVAADTVAARAVAQLITTGFGEGK